MTTPILPPQPSKGETSIAAGFALMIETACEDFEILQRLIRQETQLVSHTGRNDFRAGPRIQMALAKSFVFNVVRARRICEHSRGSLAVNGLERTRFLKATASVLGVRDVNEHGFDTSGRVSKPMMHKHPEDSAILDETSMVVFDDQKILMGPLNLYDIYIPTAHMRTLAGFASLHHLEKTR
jgi:hypothetical protein